MPPQNSVGTPGDRIGAGQSGGLPNPNGIAQDAIRVRPVVGQLLHANALDPLAQRQRRQRHEVAREAGIDPVREQCRPALSCRPLPARRSVWGWRSPDESGSSSTWRRRSCRIATEPAISATASRTPRLADGRVDDAVRRRGEQARPRRPSPSIPVRTGRPASSPASRPTFAGLWTYTPTSSNCGILDERSQRVRAHRTGCPLDHPVARALHLDSLGSRASPAAPPSVNRKCDPGSPSGPAGSTHRRPPWRSTALLAIASPIPVPGYFSGAWRRRNGRKISAACSGSMPIPASRTPSTQAPSRPRSAVRWMRGGWPGAVNFSALDRRFW